MFSMDFLDQAPNLLNILQQKKTQITHYKKLCKIAPDQKSLITLQSILKDEEKHYDKISSIYKKITGCAPIEEQNVEVNITSFSEGIKQAVMIEIGFMEIYKSLGIALKKIELRETLFEIIMDEIKHFMLINQL